MNARFAYIVVSVIASAMTLSSAESAYASDVCADKVVIKEILAGWVDGHKGPDSGNSVAVGYTDASGRVHELMLNTSYNLNDTPGPSLLSLLMMAQATGQRVSLKDHFGTRCDDFDEVVLHGY